MLPSHWIGSIITADGPEPFTLDTASGQVARGQWTPMDPQQRAVGFAESSAAERQVLAAVGPAVRAVRLGLYCCPECGSWVDIARRADRWAGDRCKACAG